MSTEIERKFLVDPVESIAQILPSHMVDSYHIRQGYLLNTQEKTVRVRLLDTFAYLTIKGARIGNSCPEYEYEIPYVDGFQLFSMCDAEIDKTRHVVVDEHNQRWEIDVFRGLNDGLVVAEIELESEDTAVHLPSWVGKEVSDDPRYTNAQLIYNKAPNL